MDRRKFLSRVTVGLSGAIAGLVGVPIIGYLIAPLFEQEQDVYVPVGDVSRFQAGTTTLVQFDDPWTSEIVQMQELHAEPEDGLEPTTYRLQGDCSTS